MRVPTHLSGPSIRTLFRWYEAVLGLLVIASWGRPLVVFPRAATGLMVVYLVLVGRVVKPGSSAECSCFGGFSAGAAGWPTVICTTLLVMG